VGGVLRLGCLDNGVLGIGQSTIHLLSVLNLMKKFIFKIFILVFPFILIPLSILKLSGELTPIHDVVNLSARNSRPVLYGPAYSDQAVRYKLLSTINTHPDVIALGTSRVMQFRRNFFKNDIKFYNAGGGVDKVEHFSLFLNQVLIEAKPKIIIIGLDQYFFNQSWIDSYGSNYKERLLVDTSPEVIIQTSTLKIWQDIFSGKFSRRSLFGPSEENMLIGLNAIENHNGFRNDGSYLYGSFISDPDNPQNKDYLYRDTLSRIASGTSRFEYGTDLSPTALTDLALFLDECDKHEIYVVGFLPPYADAIYQKMSTMPEQYAYMQKIMPALMPIFDKHGFTLFDFSNITTVGATDAEIVNGFHGSEKSYLRLFMIMAQNDPILNRFSADIYYLQTKLDETKSDFIVFDDIK
jgi:hypothetical protein